MSGRSSPTRNAVFVILAVALLVLLARVTVRGRAPMEIEAPANAARRASTAREPSAANVGGASAAQPSNADGVRRMLEDYKRESVLPHWSQALTPAMQDKIAWNVPIATPMKMKLRNGSTAACILNGEKHWIPPGEPLVLHLSVQAPSGEGIDFQIDKAVLRGDPVAGAYDGGWQPTELGAIAFHDDGGDHDAVAGDKKFVAVVPLVGPAFKMRRALTALVDVDVDGQKVRCAQSFDFSPRKVFDVVSIDDHVCDGSLCVTLHIDVTERATLSFDANLFAREEPVAYTGKSGDYEVGKADVDLVFFGKVITDRGLDGPYTVSQIRGLAGPILPKHGLPPGMKPVAYGGSLPAELNEVAVMPDGALAKEGRLAFAYEKTYMTRAYKAAQFSPKEWDAEEKRARISAFERMLEAAEQSP